MSKAEQAVLPGTPKKSEAPQSIRDGKLLVRYVKPVYEKDNEDRYTVSLEFSLSLTKEHEEFLPPDVAYSYKALKAGRCGRKIVELKVDPQVLKIYFAPDLPGAEVSLLFTEITHATLAMIEETGSGKAQDVIRYSFRAKHPSAGDAHSGLRDFADNNFDKQVWIELHVVQNSILKQFREERQAEEESKEKE